MITVHLVRLIRTALEHSFNLVCEINPDNPHQLILHTEGETYRIFVVRE